LLISNHNLINSNFIFVQIKCILKVAYPEGKVREQTSSMDDIRIQCFSSKTRRHRQMLFSLQTGRTAAAALVNWCSDTAVR